MASDVYALGLILQWIDRRLRLGVDSVLIAATVLSPMDRIRDANLLRAALVRELKTEPD